MSQVVDAHHHFLDPVNNDFQKFLLSLKAGSYLPEDYIRDCSPTQISRTVHVEVMPDSPVLEVLWVEKLIADGRCNVAAIVGNSNLASPHAELELDALISASPRMRGIRYILDYDGPFNGENATHIACSNHNTDYLRDLQAATAFEKGFSLLADRNLSFDLQCAPCQLQAAADLISRHPRIRICVDHMGKPRYLNSSQLHSSELQVWRSGLERLSTFPQVYIKISMLGYAVPGWHCDQQKEEFLKTLVFEVITLFTPRRCMFCSNYHLSNGVSDSDGYLTEGPTITQMYDSFCRWISHFSEHDRNRLLGGTAIEFYRMDE